MKPGPWRSAHRSQSRRGSAIVEYVVVTTLALGALLVPLGEDDRSVLRRLIQAIQQDHAGYLYAASVPVLPRGDNPGTSIPPGSGGSGGGSSGGGDAPPGNGGSGSPGGSGPGSGPGGNGGGGLGGLIDDVVDGIGLGGGGTGLLDPGPGNDLVDDGTPSDPDGPGTDGPDLGDAACPAPGAAPATGDGAFAAAQPTQVASTHVGNPIHVVTGNKYQREVDLAIPGLRLAFIRHYNSRSRQSGALGPGWRHGFETRIQDRGDRIRLWQADGRRIDFHPEPASQVPPGIRRYQAAQHNDGTLTAGAFGYQWRWRDGTQLDFGRDTQLRSITDPDGQRLRLNHDGRGRLVGITNPQSRSLKLAYGPDGHIESITDPGGVVTRYRYDTDQRLVEVAYADHTIRRYHYEDPRDRHNLTGISVGQDAQPLARIRTWTYDEADRAVSSEHANGAGKVALQFAEQSTRVTDDDGQASVYLTGSIGGVPIVRAIQGPGCGSCQTDGKGGRTGDVAYAYNARLQMTRLTRTDGSGSRYEYDTVGRILAIHEDGTHDQSRLVARYRYADATRNPAVIIEPSVAPGRDHAWYLTYDADGNATRVTETGWAPDFQGGWQGMERSTAYEYRDGHLVAATGPNGLRQVVDSRAGEGSGVVKDAYGRIAERQNADGMTRLAYDARGRLVAITRRAESKSPARTALSYDAQGRIAAVTGPKGTAHAEYDDAGNLDAIVAPDGQRLVFSGRASDADADLPRRLRIIDPTGTITALGYDAFGRPETLALAVGTAEAAVQRFTYDVHDRLSSVTDPRGNTAHWFHDDFGNRLYHSTPDAGLVLWRYDAAGNALARVDEDGLIAQRRMSTQSGPTKSNEGAGIPLPGWRLIEPVLRPASGLIELRRTRDAEGRITGLNRKHWLRDTPVVQFSFDDARRSIETIGPGGITSTRRHDHRGRLIAQYIPGIGDVHYRYNARDQIEEIIEDGQASRFTYDALGRLIAAQTQEGSYHWIYDKGGNRLSESHNGTITRYRYAQDSNRLLSVTQEAMIASSGPGPSDARQRTLTYSPTGLPQRDGGLYYSYTAQGRVSAVFKDGIGIAAYTYNGRGQRIVKTVYDAPNRSHSTRFHYDPDNDQLIAEATVSGQVTRQYLYQGHRPVALLEAGAMHAIHTDHRGAPIAVTDQDKALIWSARYAPFGEATVNADPDGDGKKFELNLRLPGHYADAETGLYDNVHRTYDPSTGRYLTPDPLGVYDGLNTYSYVQNDPVNRIDPRGLYGIDVHYYMTYFLGLAAGIPREEVEIIAHAAQFIDHNAHTAPTETRHGIPRLQRALKAYHFTLDYQTGFKGDRIPDDRTRFEHPASNQLDRLLRAATYGAGQVCEAGNRIIAQLFGEYLHALEDTYSHRDSYNKPYDSGSNHDNNPSREVGHVNLSDRGKSAHRPDQTYNQYYIHRINDPGALPGGSRYYIDEEWAFNERRTLAMEKEVFERLRDYARQAGPTGLSTAPRLWEDLAGAGGSRVGLPGTSGIIDASERRSTTYEPAIGTTGVLQEFNSFENEIEGKTKNENDELLNSKVEILNRWLVRRNIETIPIYEESKARENRHMYLDDLNQDDPAYAGVIFKTE